MVASTGSATVANSTEVLNNFRTRNFTTNWFIVYFYYSKKTRCTCYWLLVSTIEHQSINSTIFAFVF